MNAVCKTDLKSESFKKSAKEKFQSHFFTRLFFTDNF